MTRRISPLRDFLARESSSGLLLVIAAVIGLIAANSPLSSSYFQFLSLAFEIDFLGIYISLTVLKTINYLLMTIFFYVVGLEIKRELTSGHLAKFRQAAAPLFAAVGGMAIPALLYLLIAGSVAPEGWAIPVATDIALAVGVLALMGSRVTQGLKAFLLALAVIDDIGAILIIALVYSTGVVISWLVAAVLAITLLLLLQRSRVMRTPFYLILGLLLWYCLYKAGLHPTLAGVLIGLLTPATLVEGEKAIDVEDGSLTLVERLQHKFHPLSSLIIVPIFAFANSGVALSSQGLSDAIRSPIAWGIVIGLAVGKPIGILATSLLIARFGWAELPAGTSRRTLLATGSTAGIGFTVAIFIAKLAFTEGAIQDLAVTAVIAGSLISGLFAALLFRRSS